MKTYVIHKIKTALNIGGLKITPNVLQIGDRFVKRWNCAVGQTAANVLLGDRYFLCGGIYEY